MSAETWVVLGFNDRPAAQQALDYIRAQIGQEICFAGLHEDLALIVGDVLQDETGSGE